MKLQKIATTNTQSAFKVTFGTGRQKQTKIYLTNTEQSDDFWVYEEEEHADVNAISECKYNKNSLYSKSTHTIYYPMYDSMQPYYKSAIYKKGKSLRNGTTYDFQDVTNHKLSSSLLDICHADNIMYAIEPKNQYGRYSLSCDIWSWISVDHGYMDVPLKKINTDIYDVAKLSAALMSPADIPANVVKRKFTDIKYNMLYEINGSIYNDYEGGSIAANTFKAKNQYNSTYDMLHDSNYKLKNARDYIGIGACNNNIYLKYYDTVNYPNSGSPSQPNTNKYGFCYPNVEVIKAINRYESFNAHKTNLYSIVIKTDMLNAVHEKMMDIKNVDYAIIKALEQQIVDRMCLDISNGVKSITRLLQPAHTQLYAVYVK